MEAASAFAQERHRLGALLLVRGLVSPDQLAEALEEKAETGERLGQVLLRHGWVSEEALARVLAEQQGLELINLAASPPSPAAAALLPERYARRYQAVPVRFLGEGVVLVAVADPTNVEVRDSLRLALGADLRLAVTTPADLEAAMARLYPRLEEPDEDGAEPDAAETPAARHRSDLVEVRASAESAPAIKLVNEVLRRAIEEGASDLHLEPQEDSLLVRARIDGVMQELRAVPAELQQAVTTRMKIMGELDIAERRAPQDGRATISFGGEPIDIRVAVLPSTYGEQIVLRFLYRTSRSLELSELGLARDTVSLLKHAISQPYGCVIAVGPTGSGKTTTLYAALELLNDPGRVVMTIEDPVELQLQGVNQIQVNPKAGLTFAKGLRTILRSDPDVLLVGEIRDEETAKIAVQAAMTGHLVLTTLHADNVASSVSRLKDMHVEPALLATTVNCVFAQRLARRLCPSCREPYEPGPALLQAAGLSEERAAAGGTLYRARGCGQCVGGYKGRIGFYEMLLVTPRLRRLLGHATAEEIHAAAVEEGMRTLHEDGLRLALEGHTSLEEIRRVAGERRL